MSRLIDLERGLEAGEPGEGYFVESPGLPKRFEESPGTPAWRRALEISARMRRN